MTRTRRVFTVSLALFSMLAVGTFLRIAAQQYPVLDAVANKVIQKYQPGTCDDLWRQKTQKAPPSAEEKKVLDFLHNDPQMRTVFINKVAPLIANKMFECRLIP